MIREYLLQQTSTVGINYFERSHIFLVSVLIVLSCMGLPLLVSQGAKDEDSELERHRAVESMGGLVLGVCSPLDMVSRELILVRARTLAWSFREWFRCRCRGP